MSPSPREETILSEAMLLSPEERAAYLAEVTRGDPELREEVESLLRCHGVGEFLEEAAAAELHPTVRSTPPHRGSWGPDWALQIAGTDR